MGIFDHVSAGRPVWYPWSVPSLTYTRANAAFNERKPACAVHEARTQQELQETSDLSLHVGFSINMVTPFFSVYMMKTVGLSLSYVVGFGIISQLSSILYIKMWGRYSDKFSNKTILAVSAPLYVFCIMLWTFTGSSIHAVTVVFLILINVLGGFTTSGINLAINNIGIKLAPKGDAIIYISARNMIVAAVSSIAPIAGGFVADLFASHKVQWMIGDGSLGLNVSHWNILFIIGAIMAFASLRLLRMSVNKERRRKARSSRLCEPISISS